MQRSRLSDKLKRLHGAVKLGKNFDEKAELMKALEESFGRGIKRKKK